MRAVLRIDQFSSLGFRFDGARWAGITKVPAACFIHKSSGDECCVGAPHFSFFLVFVSTESRVKLGRADWALPVSPRETVDNANVARFIHDPVSVAKRVDTAAGHREFGDMVSGAGCVGYTQREDISIGPNDPGDRVVLRPDSPLDVVSHEFGRKRTVCGDRVCGMIRTHRS